jgi:hypothetical protein
MNFKSIAVGLCVLGFSAAAFADGDMATSGNEHSTIFHYQAPADKWEVWPILTYSDQVFKSTSDWTNASGITKNEATGLMETVRGEYGFNEMLAFGVDLSMTSLTVKQSSNAATAAPNTTYSGMLNPTLFVQGRMKDMGPGAFVFGLPLSIPLANHTVDSSGNQNASTGGFSINPWVGYEMMMGPGKLGAHLAYNTFLTNRKVTFSGKSGPAPSATVQGGAKTELDVFYEMPLADTLKLGAMVNYAGQNSTVMTANSTSTNLENGVAGLGGAIYGSWIITPTIYFVPAIRYDGTADTSFINGVQSASNLYVQAYGVFVF